MTEAAGPIPTAAVPGGFTVLRPVDTRRLMTKTYDLTAAGYVARMVYPEAKTFRAEMREAAGIEAFHLHLAELESDPGAVIVRGAPKTNANLAGMLRRKLDRKDGAATLADVPRSWVMIDADKVPLPAGYSVINDPQDVARHLVDLFAGFAPELEDATCIVQFSSSAGIGEMAEAEVAAGLPPRWEAIAKSGNTTSAHLWFWLTAPQGEKALRRWADTRNQAIGHKAIDPATLDTIQAHYTAAPIFGQGLHDPLKGRRTVLVRGSVDAVTLDIPAEAPRQQRTAEGGFTLHGIAAAGFDALLARIGDPIAGFHAPIMAAVASYIATNWPNPDTDALVKTLRERIEAANPGERSQSEIDRYASDDYLGGKIQWAMDRQTEKAEQEQAERAKADAIAPTFPDRGVPLADARRQAAAAVDAFAAKMRDGAKPETMLRVTVGGGKSEAAVQGALTLLNAARAGASQRQIEAATGWAVTLMTAARGCGWGARRAALHVIAKLLQAAQQAADEGALGNGALYVLIPRHDLGGELAERIAIAHPGRAVATWRGMDAEDPSRPGKRMCLDQELPKAAAMAGVDSTAACKVCPLRGQCGYQRQRGQQADIWLGAHNLAFQTKPKGLPDAAAVVVDEAFWGAAVKGQDGATIQLALSALQEDRTAGVAGLDRQRLLNLRGLVFGALERHEAGLVMREALEAVGLGLSGAQDWHELEWRTKPKIKFPDEEWPRERILTALHEAGGNTGFSKLRATMAGYVRDLLASDGARSVNLTFAPSADLGKNQGTGPAVRFAWREDFAEWCADAPKLFLDATTHPDVLREWAPDLIVTDIEIAAPHQHVRQVTCKEFGRATFTANGAANAARLADLAIDEVVKAGGDDVLVVAQQAVEDLLRGALERRQLTAGIRLDPEDPQTFISPNGTRLHLAHHGALTGMNRWRGVARIVVVGRPAMNRSDGERLAEIIRGKPLGRVQGADDNHWPTAPAGLRMADGTGFRVGAHRHPDGLVEALRWSITEGAVLQAIGRARGVQRTTPVHVTLLGRLPLPMTVEKIEEWDAVLPDRLTIAAADAALAGVACPFAPADMVKARPDLWATEGAAEQDKRRTIGSGAPHPLVDPDRKELRGFGGLVPARYRRGLGGGRWAFALVPVVKGRELLEAITGPLAAFEPLSRPPADAEHPRAAEPAAPQPRPVPDAPPPSPPEPHPAPAPASADGARVCSMGEAPPFDFPASGAAPAPGGVKPPRPVPASPPPTARETLADLSARLERLRPPRLWGDAMDDLRMQVWRQRHADAVAAAALTEQQRHDAYGAA